MATKQVVATLENSALLFSASFSSSLDPFITKDFNNDQTVPSFFNPNLHGSSHAVETCFSLQCFVKNTTGQCSETNHQL